MICKDLIGMRQNAMSDLCENLNSVIKRAQPQYTVSFFGIELAIESASQEAAYVLRQYFIGQDNGRVGTEACERAFSCVVCYADQMEELSLGDSLRSLGNNDIGQATVHSLNESRYAIQVDGFGILVKQADNSLVVLLDRRCLCPHVNAEKQRMFGCELLRNHYVLAIGYCLVHAGGVSRDGQCVLWTGQSGAGKTTRVLELVAKGWDYCGDDVVALRRNGQSWEIRPYRRTAHVCVDTCRRFPELSELLASEPIGDKYLFRIDTYFAVYVPPRVRLEKIYYLLTDHEAEARRMSAAEAFEGLAPQFLYYLWPDDAVRVLDCVLDIATQSEVYSIGRNAEYTI